MSDLGNKEIFAKNLQHYMDLYKVSRKDLAINIDSPYSTVSDWLNAKKYPRIDKIEKLAHLFRIEKSDLIERKYKDSQINSTFTNHGVRIPVLGHVVAGVPISAVQEVLDYEEITPELAATGDFFCLKVKGDSMEPRFYEGDILVVKQQTDVDSGDVAVVLVDGEDATVKQVKKSPLGITLIGYNVAVYPPTFYSNDDIEKLPVSIIGKVIELRRPI
ncbi:LexA family transcriptional regulator [Veillonella magna]|uniref:LexA family transcriptional regulator n=1 Tax=Veillonella magna TaxID=464322 RepID=UPI001EF5B178|nr:XRE family transcriptional regulator [Veillonella magna]